MRTITRATTARGICSVLAASLAVGFASQAAGAQSAPADRAATFVCRPAATSEAPSAKMIASATLLVCEPLAITLPMSDGSMKTIGSTTAKPRPGPDLTGALTPQQVQTAYNRWLLKTLDIDPIDEHRN